MTSHALNAPLDYLPAVPEMLLLGMACVVLLVDLFLREEQRGVIFRLSQLSLLGTAAAVLLVHDPLPRIIFGGTFVADRMSDLLSVVILVVSLGVFTLARRDLEARGIQRGEFYALGLFGVLGMLVMVCAASLLTLYLGLELMSLSLYAMVALERDSARATEAAMKYFVLGALASGMLLYGMSMLYGAAGTLDLHALRNHGEWAGSHDMVMAMGVVFVVAGLAFKVGAVPFHMWLPDVYQGAPTSVTLYISAAPKVAAFAMFIRLLADGLGAQVSDWSPMLMVLSVLSLAVGNVVAIAQSNVKRMLAYSAISHAGFLLLGILAGSSAGYAASMFYAVTYALMALGGFGMVILLSRAGFEAERLDDFKGLNQRSPWLAAMMLLLMFSMAGVPPTVGFYAKLAVLDAVIQQGMTWLAVVAVVFSVIGAFYYLRVIKLMYFDEPEETAPLKAAVDGQVAVSASGLAVLGLGIFPGALMGLCAAAFLGV